MAAGPRAQQQQQPSDPPTVAFRVPATGGPIPLHQSRWVATVMAVFGVASLTAMGVVGVNYGSAPAPTAVAPATAPTAVQAQQIAQSLRIDATLAGLDSGLELRKTWGRSLTRQTAASTCNARAALAYPSAPDALLVFARSCESNAIPQ